MGIVLNDTAIKQSMLQMGITDEFNTLDEATKVQVRWNAILAQTGDAQQDVTRTAGSYTNSVKGVKGIWADFLADAGAKFTPVLTTFFNTIIDSWPTIEPMLMQLVDLLAADLPSDAATDPCDRKSGCDAAAPAGVDPVHAGGCAAAPIDHDPERRVQ